MPPLFKQMTVCGVGLIGGSLAMVARREGLAGRIVGLGRGEANLGLATERGIIDFGTRDPAAAARGASLVVLATPIRAMPATLRAMRPALPPEAIVTDVGSVKRWVIEHLEPELGPRMALVAMHPIAGRETTGAGAADPALFAGHRAIITPSARSTPAAIDAVEALWKATGARVSRMAPEVHDRVLARASHLPQAIASTLAAALEGARIDGVNAADYGAGGLRDTTRIAASSPEMWIDICLTNREALLEALAEFHGQLTAFKNALEQGDADALKKIFERGRAMRRGLS
jgi:prephenate dehydrogenase